jgi:predicted nucleotidyltransferase
VARGCHVCKRKHIHQNVERADEADVGKTKVRVASVEHLIALKLHALKHGNPRRELKDLLDVVSLCEANRIDVNGEKFEQLCKRYGTKKIHSQILAISSR